MANEEDHSDPNYVPPLEPKDVVESKQEMFKELFKWVAKDINRTNRLKGWLTNERNKGELVALAHSELSEALEAMRAHPNRISEKPMLAMQNVTCVEEELADTLIRLIDMAFTNKWDIAKALFVKMEYNKTRPYKHGGKLF